MDPTPRSAAPAELPPLPLDELARSLELSPATLREMAAGLATAEAGKGSILRERVPELLDRLVESLGIERPGYRLPGYLESAPEPWCGALRAAYAEPFAFPASLAPSQGELLKSLAANLAPRTVVEIGCFVGVSTIWLAAGLEQGGGAGTIHSVDLFDEVMPWVPYRWAYLADPMAFAVRSLAAAGLADRVRFVRADSTRFARRYATEVGQPIDLLFIDGDHTVHGCFDDFRLFLPHVAVGGVVVLHDTHPENCGHDGPRFVLDHYIHSSDAFEVVELRTTPKNFGIAVVRKLREIDLGSGVWNPEVQKSRLRRGYGFTRSEPWKRMRYSGLGTWIRRLLR